MDVSDYLWNYFFGLELGPLKNRAPGGSIRGNTSTHKNQNPSQAEAQIVLQYVYDLCLLM